ncbi:Gas vesicle protein GvpC (modular protein) [Planktothrix sp. PCC 11201]|uniref:gas vesicle protein GvpC n=1 Tax=Planktothrix sp. PCC 11201 TaxID=1729650 RepID=UPI000924001C|nr:gas vesicle protein GvpC [Planktothrix sp. PCC 11201]SKB14387.1 Gas vesicle protein GvpC (modular protein) [Planktothrix sp. PCC 11201]
MALKDQWQRERLGRQQRVQERQQHVQTTLSLWQQERQNQALDDQESRQEFVTGLQQQTQELLTNISTERLLVAQQQRQQLEDFIGQLSQEVGEFLQQTTEERSQVATQLHQQLSEFREDLEYRVADLLADYQQQRLEVREPLLENLAIFRQTLFREVEDYLGELDILHQQMAAQLQQQLQQSRTERKNAVQKLFEDLGVFRAELQDYHRKLQQTVWGSSHRQPREAVTPPRSIDPKKTITYHKTPLSSKPPLKPKTAPKPQAIPHSIKPQPTVTPSVPQPATPDQRVYQYIQTHQNGARLAEIEQALGINRVQTVDAIRVLLQRGQITQRDRVYIPAKKS